MSVTATTRMPFDDVPDLTAHEVAEALGLSYHAVLRAAKREEMVGYKICGRWRFYRTDVTAWIDACRVHRAPKPELPKYTVPVVPPVRGSREALREIERRRAHQRDDG